VFEHFTKAARDVVLRAVTEAERRDSPVVGVEHVLVALAESPRTADALRVAGLTAGGLETLLADLELAERRGGLGAADAEALRSIGIDVDAIVAGVEERHGRGALAPPQRRHRRPLTRSLRRLRRKGPAGGRVTAAKPRRHRPFTPDAKRVLELSLREALAHGDKELGPEHILLGVVGGSDPVSQALAARGVTPRLVRSALGRA
jgi:ATP-dependent Clp protease ATP-binding subunit ClpA